MVYGVTCLIHGFGLDYGVGLDYEDFSSIPHGVTYPSIVYRFGLDYKEFSSILYTLVYGALSYNLVRVPPLGHLISLSIDYTSYPPAEYIVRLYIKYIWSRYL